MSSLLVSRSIDVAAPAAHIFDILADPNRHQEIDGSGTVRAAVPGAPKRLSMGAKFGISMKLGAPYKITNEVIEFEEDRIIAWRHIGRHVWRYELVPSEDGNSTRVTESFDGRTARLPFALVLMGAPKRNATAIEKSLKRMQASFATPAEPDR
jgi:hypothetical protein